jgi:hypothetical protein
VAEWLGGVLQILVGAGLLGAAAAYMLREYELVRQRRRELRGLLRLISGEIARNVRMINGYEENPQAVAQSLEPLLKTRDWNENRVRLAQLMKSGERFDKIFTYYHVTALMEDSQLWKLMSEGEEESKEHEKGFYAHIALNRRAARGAYGAIEKELEQAGFNSDEIRKRENEIPKPDTSENNYESPETVEEEPERAEPHPATGETQEGVQTRRSSNSSDAAPLRTRRVGEEVVGGALAQGVIALGTIILPLLSAVAAGLLAVLAAVDRHIYIAGVLIVVGFLLVLVPVKVAPVLERKLSERTYTLVSALIAVFMIMAWNTLVYAFLRAVTKMLGGYL